MVAPRRCIISVLLAILLFAGIPGCGSPSENRESAWREEVSASLKSLEDQDPYHYRTHLETWTGVSGQSVYGDEKGEGSFLGGDFSVSIVRTSPAGEENLVLASQNGESYLQEGGAWRPIAMQEAPSPLYDPEFLLKLVASYGSVSLEGEEERSGVACRRYLLQLGSDKAREALPQRAWSYFSSLDYELNCRVWIGDVSAPPVSLRLEVAGSDPQESLQRYRIVFTMDPYDLGSPDIQPTPPVEG